MRWIKTKPNRPGFYWWRQYWKLTGEYCHPRIVEITHEDGKRYANAGRRRDDFKDIFRRGDIFAGPIPMPEYEYIQKGRRRR